MTETIHTRLGPVDAFGELPVSIVKGSRTYFLVRDASGYKLLSNICPHQGGAVYDEGTRFECPVHNWKFDRITGWCLNAPSRALSAIPVTVADGILYAELPVEAHVDRVGHGALVSKPGLTVQLLAHACLEISYDGFTLMTDPWLDGPAFLGAWAPYPPHDARVSDLRPDAVLLTHEHSDHFHEPTLRHFDRRTPMYVPDFPNRRMLLRLAALGFTDVRPLRFGETCDIHDGWRLTAFEPQSYWNDAFLLIDVDGFRILDLNDAGVNPRIARMVAPVDAIAVQFSASGSAYPWTWGHLSDEQKIAISAQACAGKLKVINEASRLYGASSVLPFASHFTLWHPTHREYARMMKRNTLGDVKAAMADTAIDVIDLLPGDTWDVGKGLIRRAIEDPDALFAPACAGAYREHAVDDAAFAEHYPSDESLSETEVVDYLLRLNDVPEIALCEDLTVRIRAAASTPGRELLDVSFAVESGRLRMLAQPPAIANLGIAIPLAVLGTIIRDGLSWDEAIIGYWCRFDRHPNVYHAGFWRLFQAPYFKRPVDLPSRGDGRIDAESTVAEILEAHGAVADRILRRHGLYCAGCHHSTAESIRMAARQHGIDPHRVDVLVKELNSSLHFTASERS